MVSMQHQLAVDSIAEPRDDRPAHDRNSGHSNASSVSHTAQFSGHHSSIQALLVPLALALVVPMLRMVLVLAFC